MSVELTNARRIRQYLNLSWPYITWLCARKMLENLTYAKTDQSRFGQGGTRSRLLFLYCSRLPRNFVILLAICPGGCRCRTICFKTDELQDSIGIAIPTGSAKTQSRTRHVDVAQMFIASSTPSKRNAKLETKSLSQAMGTLARSMSFAGPH